MDSPQQLITGAQAKKVVKAHALAKRCGTGTPGGTDLKLGSVDDGEYDYGPRGSVDKEKGNTRDEKETRTGDTDENVDALAREN